MRYGKFPDQERGTTARKSERRPIWQGPGRRRKEGEKED
jgi:hypothetical protein